MKKLTALILTVVFLVACLFVLIGCDPVQYKLDVNELLSNTVKIELVYYKNENPELYQLNKWQKKRPTFDFNKVTPIATLDDSKIEDVVNLLGECRYTYWNRTWNEPIGKTLILYQKNGDMLILYGCTYTNKKGKTSYPGACIKFDKDGNYIKYIGDFGYAGMDTIEQRYFPEIAESNTLP